MEFWEGAVLVVGGVWLVAHMANRQASSTAKVYQTASTGSIGTSNASNLTNITNQAGGTPTIYGEPLEPMQPPITNVIQMPARVLSPTIPAQPIYKPVTSVAPRSGAIAAPTGPIQYRPGPVRPINVML